MARRIFISYQHDDQMKAKGFNLLRWSKNVDFEFVGRHLLDPVDSNNEAYIWRKIREQIHGTSVTVVLIGKKTDDSEWVEKEVRHSFEKDPPNGIVGIRLEKGVEVPEVLHACGAEVIDWKPSEFEAAIERAFAASGRARIAASGPGGGSRCIR